MRVAVVRGNDRHSEHRLVDVLRSLPCLVTHICGTDFEVAHRLGLDSGADLYLVEASVGVNIPDFVEPSRCVVYDCYDQPDYFEPGLAYHSLLSAGCRHYAKYNYLKSSARDLLKMEPINLLAPPYIGLAGVADRALDDRSRTLEEPMFVGAPTYDIGYATLRNTKYTKTDNFCPIAVANEHNVVVYNQRAEWLYELYMAGIPVRGGLVLDYPDDHPYSNKNITNLFGAGILELGTERLDYTSQIVNLSQSKIALCPTGHARVSFRMFDIMATGVIMLLTDISDYQVLYMPKHYIAVPDGEGIAQYVKEAQENSTTLIEKARDNRRVLANTGQRILNDFLRQIKHENIQNYLREPAAHSHGMQQLTAS